MPGAAGTAADTAKKALDTQAVQFRIDERPYLTAEYIRIAGKPEMGKKLAGEVLWKNVGKTPALKVRISMRIDVLDKEPCCSADWARKASSAKGMADLGSGLNRATSVEGDNPLSGEWFNKLGHGSKLYIFGALVYRDVFGDSHTSNFCAFYKPGSIQELALWACETEHSNDMN